MGTKEQERKSISQARLICQGEYWTLAFEARLICLRDSKGLRQLALLLRERAGNFMSWIWSRELPLGESMRTDLESSPRS